MATREQLIEDFADHKYATGEKFERLINSMKVVQEPVADPAASGTSLSFIDSIEQDKDGKITATKKTLDLSNAHELNPFKGWWKTGDTLPTSGFDGAYLYFKDTTQSPVVTTIYQWNGTAYAPTGTVVDTSNVNTFETRQAVNEVKIKDENGEEVSGPAGVLSAEAVGSLGWRNVFAKVVTGTETLAEKKMLNVIKDIRIYGSAVVENYKYVVREISRNKDYSGVYRYMFALSRISDDLGNLTIVKGLSIPSTDVTLNNTGVTKLVFDFNTLSSTQKIDLVAEVTIDYSKLNDGEVIDLGNTAHWTILPSKVIKLDDRPTAGSRNSVTSDALSVYVKDPVFEKVVAGSESAGELAMLSAVKDVKLYGTDVDITKKYAIQQISRNRGTTPGYEVVLCTITSEGVKENPKTRKLLSSSVTEGSGVTNLVYDFRMLSTPFNVVLEIAVDFSKIEDGGIINLYNFNLHWAISPSKITKTDAEPIEGSMHPITSEGVGKAIKEPVFVKKFSGVTSSQELKMLSVIKDIKIYGYDVDESLDYCIRELSRNRNGVYRLIVCKLNSDGTKTIVKGMSIPAASVTESSGVTKMVYDFRTLQYAYRINMVVEVSIDYSQIENGGIIDASNVSQLWAIAPSKVHKTEPVIKPFYVGDIDCYDTDTDLTNQPFFLPSTPKVEQKYTGQLTAQKRYMSVGFDDFRDTDFNTIMPLFEKYGFRATFDRICQSDILTNADRNKLDNLFNGNHELGDHCITHFQYPYTEPLFNGQNPSSPDGEQVPYPTNDQMRLDRGDGKNAFGVSLNESVATTIDYQAPAINTAWGNLSDAECQQIREYFSVMKDTSSGTITLLDKLSNILLGTTGTSNGSWDNVTEQYTGGIFAGCKTSANHEIWERVLQITQLYYKKICGLNVSIKTWSRPGSKESHCWFEQNGLKYYDPEFTQLANYLAKFESSTITNPDGSPKTRSWIDCLREFGYTVTHDTVYPGDIDGTGCRNKAMARQFILNANGRRKDALPYSSNTTKNFDYNVIKNAYPQSAMTGSKSLAAQMYDSQSSLAFKNFIEAARRNMSNGVVDVETTDSDNTYSMRLFYEGLLKYCKVTGVELLTRQEAYDLCFNHSLLLGNLIYNPLLRNTAKEFMPDAETIPDNPDGYDGDCSVTYDEETNAPILVTNGKVRYAHYGIPCGKIKYKANIKGSGIIKVYEIANNSDRNFSVSSVGDLSGVLTVLSTRTISNSSDYGDVELSFTILDKPMQEYDQRYEGFGNKVIGIVIEYTSGLYVKDIDLRLE